MHNLPMFTFQSKHYCQIIADDCGRQVEGVGIKSHEILGHGFTKYGTVIDTMALHKKIPASIKTMALHCLSLATWARRPPVTAVTSWELAANLDQLDIPSSAIIPTLSQGIINFIFWN